MGTSNLIFRLAARSKWTTGALWWLMLWRLTPEGQKACLAYLRWVGSEQRRRWFAAGE